MAARQPVMPWPQVRGRRLVRHGLAGDGFPTLAQSARASCGTHAQIMSAAELSLGLRCPAATRSDVRTALWSDQTLIKTYGPRGTVHLLPTEDLSRWLAALAAVPREGGVPETMAMTEDQTAAVITAIGEAVSEAGERGLTMEELNEQVPARTGSWAGDLVMPAFQTMWPRWRQSLNGAAHQGAVIFGPDRGRQVSYRSPAPFLASQPTPSQTEALGWLVHAYLHAYGPARARDFARWLAAPVRWAERLFAELSAELTEVQFADDIAYVAQQDTNLPVQEVAKGVRLLPYFDALVVGSHPRELLFPGKAAERALSPSGQAGNFPTLLIDGEVAGVWHAKRTGSKIAITVEPLGSLRGAERRSLEDEVERVGTIIEARPSLTIGTVFVGGHA